MGMFDSSDDEDESFWNYFVLINVVAGLGGLLWPIMILIERW
jgi:hypothetical protein